MWIASWSYDPNSKIFDLVFNQRAGISGATEIFVPATRIYPKGWDITVDSDSKGKWSLSFDAPTGIASLSVDSGTARHHVRLAPKD